MALLSQVARFILKSKPNKVRPRITRTSPKKPGSKKTGPVTPNNSIFDKSKTKAMSKELRASVKDKGGSRSKPHFQPEEQIPLGESKAPAIRKSATGTRKTTGQRRSKQVKTSESARKDVARGARKEEKRRKRIGGR